MRFEFTEDRRYIRDCLIQPQVWRMSTNDEMAGIKPGLFFIPYDRYKWMKVDGFGLFMIEGIDNFTCRVHVALQPASFGSADEICRQGIKWLFENTSYLNVEALVPGFNRLACRLAKESGLNLVKTLRRSFSKNGVAHDQYLYQINKGEICQH